jgi:hypothetical protein
MKFATTPSLCSVAVAIISKLILVQLCVRISRTSLLAAAYKSSSYIFFFYLMCMLTAKEKYKYQVVKSPGMLRKIHFFADLGQIVC